jgi:prepilin-type N-terminal cleavage/methylation domain-containing protein
MPVHSCHRLRPPGFTLAEILIAIAIFALLVSAIMGSFSGVFSRTETIAVQRSNTAMARACLMRMTTDLANAYVVQPPFFTPPESTEPPSPFRFVASGTSDNTTPRILLQFASRAHVDFSAQKRQGIAVIRYYLETTNDEGPAPTFRLRRADILADSEKTSGNSNCSTSTWKENPSKNGIRLPSTRISPPRGLSGFASNWPPPQGPPSTRP